MHFFISSADMPATRTTLFRLVSPAAIVTEERGRFKSFAKKSMQAALALPSTGGEVMESFRALPTSPVMAVFLARGWTLMAKVVPVGEFLIFTIEKNFHHRGHREPQGKSIPFSFDLPCGSLCPLW
jgi:hypothetical protein